VFQEHDGILADDLEDGEELEIDPCAALKRGVTRQVVQPYGCVRTGIVL
jgi:hypothetical protein